MSGKLYRKSIFIYQQMCQICWMVFSTFVQFKHLMKSAFMAQRSQRVTDISRRNCGLLRIYSLASFKYCNVIFFPTVPCGPTNHSERDTSEKNDFKGTCALCINFCSNIYWLSGWTKASTIVRSILNVMPIMTTIHWVSNYVAFLAHSLLHSAMNEYHGHQTWNGICRQNGMCGQIWTRDSKEAAAGSNFAHLSSPLVHCKLKVNFNQAELHMFKNTNVSTVLSLLFTR